ncbi:MAG: conserved phage C-terminal domain-containing protein, partial [Bacillota bacterium]
KQKKDSIPYAEILGYLNEVCGTKYKSVESNNKHIRARWNDGYRLDDFKTVIDKKAAEWLGTEQAKYLRPETLFGNKFDGYLNQLDAKGKEEDGLLWLS